MKIAAVQLNATFANVQDNLQKVEKLIIKAVKQKIELLVLPEFFTSAIGFSEKMFNVVHCNRVVLNFMKNISTYYNIILGGSFLEFDENNVYNTFHLVFPNSQIFSHRKDIPTQFENCYYTTGDTVNILNTPIGNIGVALCWEMLRYDTLKRMAGKVDIVLAGSCWWDLPDNAPIERAELRKYNQQLALDTPVTFAQLLHVPVIHSSHCGKVTALSFPNSEIYQTRQLVGAAQIIDKNGIIIAKRSFEQGEGFVFAEMQWDKEEKASTTITTSKYWIPNLPEEYISAWERNNAIGKDYYENISLSLYIQTL